MENYMYARIPADKISEIGVTAPRFEVDGYVIVNQDDLLLYGAPEQALNDKVSALGGEMLTALQARKVIETKYTAK